MANLMFKMGNYAGLKDAQGKAGTIYVTKDQHSMYVDISDTERIKIQGTVVAYDNLKDFGDNVQPPYDSSVVYFIADKDALVRWNASANEGKGAWVRLNTPASSLQEVIDSVNTLSGQVSDLRSELDTANTGIKARLTAVENKATQNATDIDALEAELNTADTGLKARMTAAEDRLDAAEKDIEAAEGRLNTAEGQISTLEGKVSANEGKITALENADTALGGRLTTAEGDIDALEAELNTASTGLKARMTAAETEISGVKGRMDTAEGQISTLDGKVTALEGADTAFGNKLTTAEGKITAAEGKITAAEGKITALEGRANASESEITGVKGRLDIAEGQISTLQDELTAANTGIKARLTAVENKATKNAGDITNVGNRVTANETAIGDDNTAGSVKGRIKALETTAGTVETRLSTAEGSISDLDTIVKASGTGLVDKMTAVENKATKNAEDIAKNAGNITKNAEAIAKNAEDIGKNAQAIAKNAEDIGVNAGAIADIQGEIDVINELIGNGAESGDTGNIASRLGAIEQKATDNATAVGNLQTAVKSLQDDLNTADTGLKARMTAAESAIGVNAGAISDLDAKVVENYALKTEVEKVEEDLTKSINDKIRAANTMQYKTSVDSFDDLPVIADNIKIGDTYVVAGAFEVLDGDSVIYYQAGDLIIASGTESEETGFIVEDLAWNRVETGFNPELEPELAVANNVISLTGGTGNPLGDITLVSANDNLTIETEGTTVTFNMVWGSF